MAGEPVAAEVLVVAVVGEYVPADDEDGMADGDGGFWWPMRRVAARTGRRGRCRGFGGAHAHWLEDLAEPSVALCGFTGSLFAAGDVVPGAHPGPRRQVSSGREAGHVTPISAMMHSAARLPTPGDRVEPVTGCHERGDHPVDLDIERGDRGFEMSDVVEDEAQHRGVMVTEPAP